MQVSTDELYHLVMAAHYLNVPRLLDLCTDAMAERIRGKSPAQVRECFGLKPSLSPEEVRRVAPFNPAGHWREPVRGSPPFQTSVCKGGLLAMAGRPIPASLKATKCTSTEGSWTAENAHVKKRKTL